MADFELSYYESQRRHFHLSILGIAERLEELAAEVRRTASRIPGEGRTPKPTVFARVATNVQHDVLCGLANLRLDALTERVGDVQEAANALAAAQSEDPS